VRAAHPRRLVLIRGQIPRQPAIQMATAFFGGAKQAALREFSGRQGTGSDVVRPPRMSSPDYVGQAVEDGVPGVILDNG
jgi:hypothetical protein